MQNDFNDTYSSAPAFSIPWRTLLGLFLLFLGLAVFAWVFWEVWNLYQYGASFQRFDKLIPESIMFGKSERTDFYIPREILVYSLPLFILSIAIQLGTTLLKNATGYLEKKKS